jgi:hypothetical protein
MARISGIDRQTCILNLCSILMNNINGLQSLDRKQSVIFLTSLGYEENPRTDLKLSRAQIGWVWLSDAIVLFGLEGNGKQTPKS